ncbi:MAG: ABC transporter ATP-binding protein [Actinomycetota bacterium]|jgi:ABC-type branched-subunit amino acid transport system ATPase component|nr:ABC transporter ATP-binding protein [Actinomycetota bacterium]
MALLEVQGVSKAFGGLIALDDCSLSVEEGEVAGLIGPNGSGKTTLFNVITGYVRPDRGSVRLRGADITGASPARVFGLGLGRTFQQARIFDRLSVLENMLVATQRQEGWLRSVVKGQSSPKERARAGELLQFVGLERLARLPAGNLSFGQRKLLELAYVLVADPQIILLDEPAGGVNPTLINLIAARIRTLNDAGAGKTFLVVEHNMEFVMGLCDTVTVMHQGAAIVSGSPDMVREDPRVLDAYLGGSDDELFEPEPEPEGGAETRLGAVDGRSRT